MAGDPGPSGQRPRQGGGVGLFSWPPVNKPLAENQLGKLGSLYYCLLSPFQRQQGWGMCLVLATCEGVNSGKVRIRTELAPLHSVLGLAWQELMSPKHSLILDSEL